jgi:hypothetical protein
MIYQLRMHEFHECIQVLYYSLEKSKSICGSPHCFVVVTESTDRFTDIERISLKRAKKILR